MAHNESREDYLEAILQLSEKLSVVRSIDVANHLKFSRPSVSIAMKKLKEDELIDIASNGGLSLTEKGKEVASRTLEKHEFLTNAFIRIGVDPKLAEDQACEIEHIITADTFEKLKKFVEKLDK